MESNLHPNILLEAGTNEVEVMEFFLDAAMFGVNAAKVKQIILYDAKQVAFMVNRHRAVLGMLLLRGKPIPIVDLNIALGRERTMDPPERRVIIVMEFNGVINGFLVDGVRRIQRMSWKEFKPLPAVFGHLSGMIIGVVHIDDHETMIVDFEHIVNELSPDVRMAYHPTFKHDAVEAKRCQVRVMLAEDSMTIRNTITSILKQAGYTQLEVHSNGQSAYNSLRKYRDKEANGESKFSENVHILISDIEMPEKDGLSLCRDVRQELGMREVPIIMFSSLISEQMAHKCKTVGASGWTTKPQIGELVGLIDRFAGLVS